MSALFRDGLAYFQRGHGPLNHVILRPMCGEAGPLFENPATIQVFFAEGPSR